MQRRRRHFGRNPLDFRENPLSGRKNPLYFRPEGTDTFHLKVQMSFAQRYRPLSSKGTDIPVPKVQISLAKGTDLLEPKVQIPLRLKYRGFFRKSRGFRPKSRGFHENHVKKWVNPRASSHQLDRKTRIMVYCASNKNKGKIYHVQNPLLRRSATRSSSAMAGRRSA